MKKIVNEWKFSRKMKYRKTCVKQKSLQNVVYGNFYSVTISHHLYLKFAIQLFTNADR